MVFVLSLTNIYESLAHTLGKQDYPFLRQKIHPYAMSQGKYGLLIHILQVIFTSKQLFIHTKPFA